ncbi:hypothetical protein N7522_003007 [Penicillium canescens]|nr:hypothetical protein N7522_003007 [Penicillium canescens]
MSPPRACLRAPEEFHRFYLSADQANLSLQLPLPLSSSATSPTYRKVNGIKGSAALNDEESRLPKVPIPRAVHSVNAVTTGRVDQACQPCREQKAKCSGHRPKCRRCEENSLFCIYEDRKRARTTKQLDHLGSQVRAYEALLRQLYPKLGFEDANHVDHIFGSKSDDRRPLEKDRLAPSQDPAHQLHENDYHNNYNVSLFAVVADCTTEDYNQKGGMQAMGYVGDHSGIKWLYRLKHHLDDAYPNSNVQGNSHDCSDLPNISSANYYLDDLKLQFPDDVDISRRPPREIADQLVTAYFGLTHIFFAFVRKDIFLSQYRSFYSNHAPKPGRKWLALFNLVLAISAEQAYKLKKDSRPKLPADRECNAPNMFFGRAWHLAMTDSLLEPSNLQQVQVEALASLYLLSAGHANRLVILIMSMSGLITGGANV